MNTSLKSAFAGLLLASIATPFMAHGADLSVVPSGNYANDKTHSYLQFQYSHLGLSNPKLGFEDVSINLTLDSAKPENSSVTVSIGVDSVVTGSEIFYQHLTGEKWFDSAKFESISFSSTELTANADGTYTMAGNLTVRDVTKPVTLNVTINNAMMHPMAKKPVVGISATGSLNRSDWGLGAYAPNISDNVNLHIEAEMLAES